ncbi:hypothetical protein NJF44_13225 [Pseudomonas guariconensis]|uniref:hypothetical protein n=1 Tax=Pseudomonas TaxID=286 RepID=UPI001CE45455|nr:MULTISPECIES: hypothetical protein [Pseudomonas]MCO7640275.1 hypothetical protein [Pseudomonas sp. S 311-6]MCO7513627.1 hypothetical protein [Pseudomonas putida]MCO7565533.1 hypothetical protein [Pseudomonas mosselii]MCO7593213.1 hypothetical protein [Pseudomonas guariconensis]MCO7606200.1 hypothetical protein [Pseudomonas guariconensis]
MEPTRSPLPRPSPAAEGDPRRLFARLHPRHKTPAVNIVVVGVLYLTWLTKAFRVAPPSYIAE